MLLLTPEPPVLDSKRAPALEDFVVEVVLKGLAELDLFLLLLQLAVRLGALAALPPRGGLVRVVPLLLVLDVLVRRHARRQLCGCEGQRRKCKRRERRVCRSARQTLTLEAVVELEEVAVLQLPPIDDLVVRDVAVWAGGRFPLQDDLGG